MKNMFILFVLHICTSVVLAQPNKPLEIKYEDLLKQNKSINLSSIATNVAYVKLETNVQCLLGSHTEYFFTKDLILVYTGNHIIKFSYTGKFLGKILSAGRGPGEIDAGAIMSFIPDRALIADQNFSRKELLYFDFNGKLVKKVNYTPNIGCIMVLNDLKYLIYNFETDPTTKFTFRLSNANNDTISVIKNYLVNKKINMTFNFNHPNFVRWHYSGKQVYFKSLYKNDTVYSIYSNKIVPHYYINLGKYKIPDELIPEKIAGTDKMKDFKLQADNFYYANVLDNSKNIFLSTYSFGHAFPKYFLIDKLTQKGNLLVNNLGESTGIINDWDGGSDFWPSGNISDDKLYMIKDILSFKKEIDKNVLNKGNVLLPEQQRQLNNMISESDPLDNPIIMIVTVKSNK